jgi:hypothetical protein
MKANTSIYFHHDSGNNFLRTCSVTEWSAVHNDAGSTIVASTDEDVLIALYNELNALSIGDYYGQYSSTSAEMTNDQASLAITLVGDLIANEQTSGYADAYTTLVQIKANLAQNVPVAGLYRFKNVSTGKYLVATAVTSYNSTTDAVFANGDANDVATILRLYEDNGHLYLSNQGYGFGWVTSDGSYGSTGKVWITSNPDKYINWLPGTAANQVAFAVCLGNATGTWASQLNKAIFTADDNEAVIAGTDETIDAAQWIIEEATSATVSLNGPVDSKYYATLCVPFDITLEEGTTAYTLSKSGTELTTAAVSGTVAAGTPVLLEGGSTTATATIVGTNYSSAISTETALTGTYLEIANFDGAANYVLGTDGTKVGFYHWKGTKLNANRAYIAGSGSGVKGYVLNFDDDATGIKDLKDRNNSKDIIFNVAGQRMNKMQKGINIINGKKIVVK